MRHDGVGEPPLTHQYRLVKDVNLDPPLRAPDWAWIFKPTLVRQSVSSRDGIHDLLARWPWVPARRRVCLSDGGVSPGVWLRGVSLCAGAAWLRCHQDRRAIDEGRSWARGVAMTEETGC